MLINKRFYGILLLTLVISFFCDRNGFTVESKKKERIYLTPEQLKELNIIVEPLRWGDVDSLIQRPSTLFFNPDRVAKVGPRIKAKVEKVIADLGKWVRPGDKLALLSSVELGKIKADYFRQLARYRVKKANYLREKTLFKKKISSEADYLDAKAQFEQAMEELHMAEETLRLYGISLTKLKKEHQKKGGMPLSYFYLRSPIEGIVQKRDITPGETLSSQDTPFHIVDPREMWLMIDVYEQDIPKLSTGKKVIFATPSLPGKRFTGTIDWISQSLNEKTRTLRVRARIKDPELILKNGMYGTAFILGKAKKSKPIVPVDAVQTIDNRHVIFVAEDKQGSFKAVPVILGSENNGWVEIISELKPDIRMVTKGSFHLKAILTEGTFGEEH